MRTVVKNMFFSDWCEKCKAPIFVAEDENGKEYILDEVPTHLYTLADHKIYGTIEGYQIHKCKGE